MNETPPKSRIGLEMHEAHFPGVSQIDAYGNGGFRFADMSHRGSILCLPSGIYGWNIQAAEELSVDYLDRVFQEDPMIDVFLVGLGLDIKPLGGELREVFSQAGIVVEPMATGAAVRTYNVLLSERRAVGCGLIAV